LIDNQRPYFELESEYSSYLSTTNTNESFLDDSILSEVSH